MPGAINEPRKSKSHSISSVMWKKALSKIRDKRLSSVAEDAELAQTLSGALNCKSSIVPIWLSTCSMHSHTNIYTHYMYLCVCMYICIFVCICVVCVCVCVSVCVCILVCFLCMYIYVHVFVFV